MNSEDVSVTAPRPSRRASEMPRYMRSDLLIKEGVELLQLSKNESAIPMQPNWMEAAVQAASAGAAYPDAECKLLRQAIAETFRLDAQRIICSAGLMECLQTIALAYLDPGDKVVIPGHAFVFFRHVATLAGAEVKLVPERNLRVDINRILEAVDESTKMVIFANPGNPTGTYLCKQCIAELRSRIPSTTLLVIDEAYAEFVQEDRYEPLFDLTDSGNMIVLRSFSKMYGLAGFRVGWAYCPRAVVDYLRRIQIPAIVSAIAQAVAAAAIRDQRCVRAFKHEMLAIRRRFIERLKRLPRISPVESETNFVLLRTKSEAEAQDLDDFLRKRGIVLRRQMAVGLSECLRATIGTEEQMSFVASAIVEWCGG
jgi:histidinol-phosphate aminotransferase